MREINTSDLQEIKPPSSEGFKEIKPEKGTSVEDARGFWKQELFGKHDSSEDQAKTETENRIADPADDGNTSIENEKKPEHIDTINQELAGRTHEKTGVPFESRVIELPGGRLIEGVFPRFDSVFDVRLPENLYMEKDGTQAKECCRQLLHKIETDPDLRSRFSDEQIDQIKDGTVPEGYVWHHDAEPGKMQLVESKQHAGAAHTGGRFLWGGGSDHR